MALLVGLAAAALVHGSGAPPVYDGIIVPAEPYRWESPPPSLRAGNQPPLSGKTTLTVSNGQVAGGSIRTGDDQVVIYLGPGAFTVPGGTKTVTCTIQPDPNPPPAPSGVDIRGNVYRISCVGEPGGVPVMVASTYHLTLRFPDGPFNQIWFNDGNGWRALATFRAPSGDPYASVNAPGFGELAATAPTGAQSDSIFTVLGRYVEFFGILALVIIFGTIAVVQEIRRRGRQTAKPPPAKPRRRE